MDAIITLLLQFPVKLLISKLFGMSNLTMLRNVRPAAKLVFGSLVNRIVLTDFLKVCKEMNFTFISQFLSILWHLCPSREQHALDLHRGNL